MGKVIWRNPAWLIRTARCVVLLSRWVRAALAAAHSNVVTFRHVFRHNYSASRRLRITITIGIGVLIGMGTLAGVTAYMVRQGLDRADKLGSALGLGVGLMSLVLAGLTFGLELAAQRRRRCQAVPSYLDESAKNADIVQRRVPMQLLQDVADFCGRDAELSLLDAFFSARSQGVTASAVVVISGMAGTGKSSLAIHWGQHRSKSFPDGQLYIDLQGYGHGRPLSSAKAIASLLEGLGVSARNLPKRFRDRVAEYRTRLHGKRVLVVLDNARSVDQVEPLLPGGSSCFVLVTSRNELLGLSIRHGARRVQLKPLRPPDACKLLSLLIGRRASLDPRATARLANYCGYLPLTLRVAAERAAARPRDPLDHIASELASRRYRLSELSTGADQSLAVSTVLSWSYEGIPSDLARAFRLLGLNPGRDISLEAAAALLDTTTTQASRLLRSLTGEHLIEYRGANRYKFHDLVGIYAESRARSDESDEVRASAISRLLWWYLLTARNGTIRIAPHRRVASISDHPQVRPLRFKGRADVLKWYDAELPNLVAATRFAFRLSSYEVAWKLPSALWEFFDLQKDWNEWIATHQIGLKASKAIGDEFAEAWTANGLAIAYMEIGSLEKAGRYYQRALELQTSIGDIRGQAATLINLGTFYGERGRTKEEFHYVGLAIAAAHKAGDLWAQAMALNNLGSMYKDVGNYAKAIENCNKALTLWRTLGNEPGGESLSLANLGDTYRLMGSPEIAFDYLDQALKLRRLGGGGQERAWILYILGDAYRLAGQNEDAGECWRAALVILDELNDRHADEVRARLENDLD